MYRVTDLKTRETRIVDCLNHVRWGSNGWEPCEASESEAVAVPGLGACHVQAPTTADEDMRPANGDDLPVVVVVRDNGEAVTRAEKTAAEHAGQLTDLEACALDLADAVDAGTMDTEAALVDLADNQTALEARIAALEAALASRAAD